MESETYDMDFPILEVGGNAPDKIFYNRNISRGLGSRDSTYEMIASLPLDSAMDVLRECVRNYGSWSDIKYFCRYVRANDLDDRLIDGAVSIINQQLDWDFDTWNTAFDAHLLNRRTTPRPVGREILSFAAKWVPREKSAMGWIFDRIVEMRSPPAHYNSRYRREFRKMVSTLNRELDTVEIKQCNGRTQDILYENIPISARIRQSRSFSHYPVVKGHCNWRHVDIASLVRIALSPDVTESQIQFVNSAWPRMEANGIIPIVNISSMERNYAIGLAILIAQNSSYGRLILSEHQPSCVVATADDAFMDIILRIKPHLNGVTDSNLGAAVDLLQGHPYIILENNYTNEDLKPLKN